MMPAIKKAFNLMGDDIIELDAENKSLKDKIGELRRKMVTGIESKTSKTNR